MILPRIHLGRAGNHGGLLGTIGNVELGKGCLEALGELSTKSLYAAVLDGFLALVFDFRHLESSLDDLLLGVTRIEEHLGSLLNRNHKFPSAHSVGSSCVFVQFEVAGVCSHGFCREMNKKERLLVVF